MRAPRNAIVPLLGAPEQRRLARAVRADDRHDLALADVDRHVAQRDDRPVRARQVAHLQDFHAASPM
jgi:hypothetical protein